MNKLLSSNTLIPTVIWLVTTPILTIISLINFNSLLDIFNSHPLAGFFFVALWLCPICFLFIFRELGDIDPKLRAIYGLVGIVLAVVSAQIGKLLVGELVTIEVLLLQLCWTGIALSLIVLSITGYRYDQLRKQPASNRVSWYLAGVFAAIFFIFQLFILLDNGYIIGPDSPSYGAISTALFDSDSTFHPRARSLPYPLLISVVNGAEHPLRLIIFQMILGSFAVAAIVHVLSQQNRFVAILLGFVLSLDVVWAHYNLAMMTEGITATFYLLSFALLIRHFTYRNAISTLELIGAGLFYAWTLAIRPSNLPLLALIGFAYLVFLHPRIRFGWVAGGMAMLLIGLMAIYQIRFDRFTLVGEGSGIYVGWPLFSYQIFSPDNGPTSKELDQLFQLCVDDINYEDIRIENSNTYLWGLANCLEAKGMTLQEISDLFSAAYREAIERYPWEFTNVVLYENARFYASPVAYQMEPPFCCDPASTLTISACSQCHNDAASRSRNYPLRLHASISSLFQQPFQFFAAGLTNLYPIPYFAGWLLWVSIGLLLTRGVLRFVILCSAIFMLATSFSIVIGHVFINRYASPLNPFHTIISAITLISLGQVLFGRRLAAQDEHLEASAP